ncbi:hydroquinone glucosyltransferase-like [Gastrolobium bilobum]|uniref:hydroquinone glucosyltransferase-like n=1 Tax=Gastrolobium bilobum TaxID=150636 RepID=UPI002AAF9560|nr:hydroquinone glucosyltransferase-like [Gastrolobium bilobum]
MCTHKKFCLYNSALVVPYLTSYLMEKKARIAMVACPGVSHLIPLVEFAKRLVLQYHEFHVTLFIPTLGSPSPSMKAILEALPPNIDFTILPQVNMEDLPHNLHPSAHIRLTVKHSLPFLHEALSSLNSHTHLVALVLDLFSCDAIDVAKKLNLLSYVFFASGATTLSFCLSFPKLEESIVSSEFLDLTKTVNVPGCVIPFKVKDLPEPVLYERSNETYKLFVSLCERLWLVDGIMVNSFTDLEAEVIRAMQEKESNRDGPCVYPVGPIIQNESSNKVNESVCLRWLENQPPNSVLYVCFGSGGTLPHDQFNEIAYGLELSGHNFLWVVRAPNKSASSAYLVGQKEDPLYYLPQGFLDRTKGQGLVVPSWAPQIEVLGHGSTGGFLSHCGWNSTLESVVHRVPMIAWPLFAEQRMNAVLLTDVLKVAVRPKVVENGIVKREEIANVIKRVMEGHESLEMHKRIKELSDGAAAALSEHGSSYCTLSSLAQKWLNI